MDQGFFLEAVIFPISEQIEGGLLCVGQGCNLAAVRCQITAVGDDRERPAQIFERIEIRVESGQAGQLIDRRAEIIAADNVRQLERVKVAIRRIGFVRPEQIRRLIRFDDLVRGAGQAGGQPQLAVDGVILPERGAMVAVEDEQRRLVAGIEIVAERGEHGRRIADALEIDGERLH